MKEKRAKLLSYFTSRVIKTGRYSPDIKLPDKKRKALRSAAEPTGKWKIEDPTVTSY